MYILPDLSTQSHAYACVGREQISQDGGSGSLAPHSVNSEAVTAEIICSSAHGRQEVLAWPGYSARDACMSAT